MQSTHGDWRSLSSGRKPLDDASHSSYNGSEMKPIELYQREPERVVVAFEVARDYMPDYLIGCCYNHLQEIYYNQYDICMVNSSDKVVIKVYKDFNFDGRRFWRLCSVWYDGEPVMILQNAGREGDDYVGRYITDYNRFNAMIIHIESLITIKIDRDLAVKDTIKPDSDVPELDNFYGNALDGQFDIY